MFKNLKLGIKLNLLLVVIFVAIVGLSALSLYNVLQRNAEQTITNKALLLIDTMKSIRTYTGNQIRPELAERLETESQFLPQTVPAYSAREVFENLRTSPEYRNFFYKEATLNPTNLRDKADAFEMQVVKKFREQPSLEEQTGFRNLSSGDIFYIARPLIVSQESCLRCHSTPERAPKSQLATYGDRNGFGWELNEVVGAQMISVPASNVIKEAQRLQWIVIGILSAFLLLAIFLINAFLKFTITNPLKNMSQLAQRISTGDMSGEFTQDNNDEIGMLAASLNRMKVSLEMAMNMLNQESE